ncbi:MAG TPA: hypothetical protein VMF90_21020 [Rhizobiaceae bacterium]|nr:hypothetical protein [Rhizobiaceae bacterium]
MDRKIKDQPKREELPEVPGIAEQDWDALDSGALKPESMPDNGDIRYDEDEPTGELPEEDDDNPDQESDEALPDDREERAIAQNPTKEATRFGEVGARKR